MSQDRKKLKDELLRLERGIQDLEQARDEIEHELRRLRDAQQRSGGLGPELQNRISGLERNRLQTVADIESQKKRCEELMSRLMD